MGEPHVGLELFEDRFWAALTSLKVVVQVLWQLTSREGWVNEETIMLANVVNILLVQWLGGFMVVHLSGSGNIFAFGAGWVGHAMQIGHIWVILGDTISAFSMSKKDTSQCLFL